MAKQNPTSLFSGTPGKRQAPSRILNTPVQSAAARRNSRKDTVYCERCGEYYADTYTRCPFCDEWNGRRVGDRGSSRRSPLQLAVLVITLVIILAAAFIVLTKIAPMLAGRNNDPTPDVDAPSQGELLPPVVEEPVVDPGSVPARAIVLNREDFTLAPGETYPLTATVSPSNSTDTIVWSCDRPDVLEVGQDGTVTNKNATGEKVTLTLTVTAGGVSAECIVRCHTSEPAPGSNTGSNTGSGSGSSGSSDISTSGGAAISGKTQGVVVGAEDGLNVRSGPGSKHPKVASITNGSTVTILENTGTGWYKIDYGYNLTGYASVDYIQPK